MVQRTVEDTRRWNFGRCRTDLFSKPEHAQEIHNVILIQCLISVVTFCLSPWFGFVGFFFPFLFKSSSILSLSYQEPWGEMLWQNQTVTTRVLRKADKLYGKVPWSRGHSAPSFLLSFWEVKLHMLCRVEKTQRYWKNINNSIQWVFYVSEHSLRRNSCMFWIMYSSEIFRNSKNYLWSACEDNSGPSTKLKMSFFLSSTFSITHRYLISQKKSVPQ